MDNLQFVRDENIVFTVNGHLCLETLPMEIRGKCILYSSFKKKSRNLKEEKLAEEIKVLERNLAQPLTLLKTPDDNKRIRRYKKTKNGWCLHKVKGNMGERRRKTYTIFWNLESKDFLS